MRKKITKKKMMMKIMIKTCLKMKTGILKMNKLMIIMKKMNNKLRMKTAKMKVKMKNLLWMKKFNRS